MEKPTRGDGDRPPEEPPGDDVAGIVDSGVNPRERHGPGQRIDWQPQLRDLRADHARECGG